MYHKTCSSDHATRPLPRLRPPFPSFARMPGLPCPVSGCRGWTNTRRGKWHSLAPDFSLQLDITRLALHQRVCSDCWNRHTNHRISPNVRRCPPSLW